ncbi:glycerophosphodiester phosphodiesterase family protein [bacterium]|nr:glycerophosphodiester phosphodiesterase family protein [bacterium]
MKKITLSPKSLVTLGLILLLNSSHCIECNAQQDPHNMPTKGICAHRGASVTHPENTIPAMKEAIRVGVHMIEFDVAMTQDGRLVLMHDSTVDRTTNGSGKVNELTLLQLQALDAGSFRGSSFANTRIPTLQQALAIMPENIWLNVHLKGDTELAKATAKVITNQKRTHQCFLACNQDSAIAAKRVNPDIKICNMERQANTLDYVNQTINFGSEFIQLLGGQSADPRHVGAAKKHQIIVNYCCTNSTDTLKDLFASGVQFPLVDDIHQMMKTAKTLGIEPLQPRYRSK